MLRPGAVWLHNTGVRDSLQINSHLPWPSRLRAGRAKPVRVAMGSAAMLFVAALSAALLTGAGLGASGPAGGLGAGADRADAQAMPGAIAVTTPRPGRPADAPAPSGLAPLPTAWDALPPATPQPVAPAADPTCVRGPGGPCPTVPEPTAMPSVEAAGAGVTLHVPILEYHRIKPPAGETGYVQSLIVPPELFASQMDAMYSAGWHTMTMGQLGDALREGIQPSPKSFVITFDDGYEDGYTYAAPVLRQYGFVATYFIVGSQIGATDHLNVGELRALLAAGNEIGNHTMTHQDLERMGPEQLKSEIYGASALIATDVGVWPQSFAYPAGLTDQMVEAAVAMTPGIETAVIQGGSLPETWENRMLVGRIRVGPGTYPQDLVAKANRYLP